MNMFFEQKQGDPNRLYGKMTAYAIVENAESMPPEFRGEGNDGGNIFAVQADCRQEHPTQDFLKSDLGASLKKGLDQVIQHLRDSGLWQDTLTPDNGEEGAAMVRGMAELIPIMARVLTFDSEEEIMREEGDIYFLGTFADWPGASMYGQAFSLLYQTRYREQERNTAKQSIDDLLSQIEKQASENEIFTNTSDLEKKMLGNYIPAILYSLPNPAEHQKAIARFRRFMHGYRFPEDVDRIIEAVQNVKSPDAKTTKKLELLIKKIVAMSKEDFSALAVIQRELNGIEKS